jgi:hypothetical protein
MTNKDNYEIIGTSDLRFKECIGDGFCHVGLYDADDQDFILLNEEEIPLLIERLQKFIKDHNLNLKE